MWNQNRAANVLNSQSIIGIEEHVVMSKLVLLLFLFAFGISMIVNGCGTLLQVLP